MKKTKTPPAPSAPREPRSNTTVVDDIAMQVLVLEFDRRTASTAKKFRDLSDDFARVADALDEGGLDVDVFHAPNYHSVMHALCEVHSLDNEQRALKNLFGILHPLTKLEELPQVRAARANMPGAK